MNQITHVYPETVSDVIKYLENPHAKLLAGGTAMTLLANKEVNTFVDLQKTNLSYIKEEDDRFLIGGTTSAYDIFRNENLPKSFRTAADKIADLSLLHAITLGGNFAILYKWVDLPPILWALNSSITIRGKEERTMNLDEFFPYSREKSIANRNELITEIQLPKPPTNSYSEYQTLTLIENEKGQLNLASYFEWNENKEITIARLVASAAFKGPKRLECEQFIIGKRIDDELINKCKETINAEDLVKFYKSSKEYRAEILRVYIKRTMNNCLSKM
ncbi:MAG: Glyceraldehyde dehydrogenase medium chain [Candidatus Heimdallarchaeota archaeon LC_2]|nr:MAG: Glyceraldehyde dehydrogenase medium chain [Candidatus Heimdallarchaeota archaeon LC_2]